MLSYVPFQNITIRYTPKRKEATKTTNIEIILEHDNIKVVATMKDFKVTPEMLKTLEAILPAIVSKMTTSFSEKQEEKKEEKKA